MNNELNQDNQVENSNPPVQPAQPIESPPSDFVLPIASSEHKWYKSKKFLIPLILVFILGGAGGAYAYYVTTLPAEEPAKEQVATPLATPKPLAPYALAYATSKSSKDPKSSCLANTTTVQQQPLAGAESAEATTLTDGQAVGVYAVNKTNALFATTPSCNSKEPATLWLSSDSGKTYAKIHTLPSTGGTNDAFTSAVFSSDAKKVVFGHYDSKTNKNTVRELTVASKEISDLFASDESGVYLHGFDEAKGRIYYHEGCYACDATVHTDIFAYNTKDKKKETLLSNDKMYAQTVMSNDLTEGMRLRQESLGAVGGPNANKASYTVELFDVASKVTKDATTFETDLSKGSLRIGYTNDGKPYYTNGDSIFVIGENNKPSLLLQASKPIIDVHYAGDKQIIYSVSDDSQKRTAINYDVASKEFVTVLNYGYTDVVFGITFK